MIINKFRLGKHFRIQAIFITNEDAHSVACDKNSEIEQIINTALDSVKIKLDEFVESDLVKK